MDQSQHAATAGPTGRRIHIAHRRSPSELTPLMSTYIPSPQWGYSRAASTADGELGQLGIYSATNYPLVEQLAIQQQIDLLQQQQQQIAATHQQYVNMGMIQPQQHLPAGNAFSTMQGQMQNLSPQVNAFQFPQQLQQQQLHQQQQQQHLGVPVAATQAQLHRRNQSAMPSMGMGPPAAPSTGLAGSQFSDFAQQGAQGRENINPRGGRGGNQPGGGHARRHSLALTEAKKAAELAEQKRNTSGFQFPVPGSDGPNRTTADTSSSPASAETGQTPQAGFNPRLGNRGGAHGRSQSMAVGGGRGGGAQGRGVGGFQFPPPMATNDAGANAQGGQSDLQRRGSQGHGRTGSRNFDGNWRQQSNNHPSIQDQHVSNMGNFSMNQNAGMQGFQPGHRPRGSMNQPFGSLGNFQYAPQPQLIQLPQGQVLIQQPQMFAGQGLNQFQLAQLQALQAAQAGGHGIPNISLPQNMQSHMSVQQQQQQQQRKTLFTPYLPQATLPALLSDGSLVAGTLRVNKKNRSDAYVTTNDLDADIFICGSKDRNRALEGDLVAVELLDVDEVWGQKREKEEKKKRKDITDTRSGSIAGLESVSHGDSSQSGNAEGGIRRRGSLRQRPTQKKNDDVEVEGQSLLLMEEEEISDEAKPLYAGHIVAVIERTPGQMFSGTLGLLRPSSQATKEKQEAERQAREGHGGRHPLDRQMEKPKIVWFKPTDKRVPLIAIPTEQAPKGFVEDHQKFANNIFVAAIKRWPITSLHPFGTLSENLGEMGNLKAETDALLRDNNFGPDEFSEALLKNIGFDDWSVANDGEEALQNRRDLREEETFTIDPNGAKELDDAIHFNLLGNGNVEIGIHVADVAHFIKPNSLVDREAKKRGTGVYLMNRTVNMLPPRLSAEICSLSPGEERYTVSVIFKANLETGQVFEDATWVGKAVIKSSRKLSYDEVDTVINGQGDAGLGEEKAEAIKMLNDITQKFREARFGNRSTNIPSLRLLYQLDDENVPVEHNIFDSSPAHELIEELSHKTNTFVAQKIAQAFPDKAFVRRHAPPNPRRLQTFADRMIRLGYDIDTSSSETLQNSLFNVEDSDIRKGMETLLVTTMQRAKYFVPGRNPTQDGYFSHYALNLPLYTHFTNPSRRYADIIVHRQLESILSDGSIEFLEDTESLAKTAELCNNKKDSAHAAQEQSVHIESCRMMDKKRQELGSDLISIGIVVCVYESAFDVLIPEYGFEKRVHCDQLPLKKAEFDKSKRVLELYWENGIPSSSYVPEDERPRSGPGRGFGSTRAADAGNRPTKGKEEAQRKQMDTGTMSTEDIDALFDDDDTVSEVTEMAAGVSLGQNGDTAAGRGESKPDDNVPEARLTDKEKYLSMFKLREVNGESIQDVVEMTRVPVILRTDLTKSPPCLTIRSLNPYAL